jgi:hypothetical protein
MGRGLLIVSRNALTMLYPMGPDAVKPRYAVGPHLANEGTRNRPRPSNSWPKRSHNAIPDGPRYIDEQLCSGPPHFKREHSPWAVLPKKSCKGRGVDDPESWISRDAVANTLWIGLDVILGHFIGNDNFQCGRMPYGNCSMGPDAMAMHHCMGQDVTIIELTWPRRSNNSRLVRAQI